MGVRRIPAIMAFLFATHISAMQIPDHSDSDTHMMRKRDYGSSKRRQLKQEGQVRSEDAKVDVEIAHDGRFDGAMTADALATEAVDVDIVFASLDKNRDG